ncbi:MAG: fibronectin type III domain-containing protein [Candidatus Kapabacteria bacterium]|nr:fibronectin type III domain-containing protein [Candidatus Kapabacteria bacterium]
MSYSKLLAVLFASLLMGFLVTSCTEDDPVDPTNEKPAAPTNLMALSVNETTIHLKYDISPSEQNSLFQDYFLNYWVVGETANPMTMAVAKGVNPIAVTGLEEGKIYEFQLVARYTNNENSAASANVKWSPASRFVETIFDAPIKIYESASGFGSGLQIYDGTEGPSSLTVTNGANWDLGLETAGNTIMFGSATKLGYNFQTQPQPTFMMTDYFLADALNDVFDSRSMDDGDRNTKYAETTLDLATVAGSQNAIFYVRKYQPGKTRYNYAKVMVERNALSGGFLHGVAPNRHLILHISYQKVEDVPYAKTASN